MTTEPVHRPTVLILNRDLFFGVRLRQALTADGWTPRIVPNATALAAALGESPNTALVVVDMAIDADWEAVTSAARTHDPVVPILAFGAHRDVDRFRAARAAGIDRVVSNGDFHRDMTGFVRRYARTAATAAHDAKEPGSTCGRTGNQADVAGDTTS